MNYAKYYLPLFLLGLLSLTSCDKDITIGEVDESKYEKVENVYASLRDVASNGQNSVLEIQDKTVSQELFLSLNCANDVAVDATVSVDEAYLSTYNTAHETDFALYPVSLVKFDNEKLTIAPGDKKSFSVNVSISRDATIETGKTYIVPIAISIDNGGVQVASKESHYILLVKDCSDIADCDKATGIKIISCMEVNDTNPLNNLPWKLEKSGKQLVDIVILFSANINYSVEEGGLYVNFNPNVAALLNNREKYLVPLQKRGMKVILGILGNHDVSGVAQLSDLGAREFARKLRDVFAAYDLDGVFFDDEYSLSPDLSNPLFAYKSSAAAARLCYEVKRLSPDKMVMCYCYGATYGFPALLDGVPAGDYVDWAVNDYGDSYPHHSAFPGMDVSACAVSSQEFNRGYWTGAGNLQNLRSSGCKGHMIFAMDPMRGNAGKQISQMGMIATELYDDVLVDTGERYTKDW